MIDGLGTGGAERSLAELVPFLKARGFELAIAYFRYRRPGVEDVLRNHLDDLLAFVAAIQRRL